MQTQTKCGWMGKKCFFVAGLMAIAGAGFAWWGASTPGRYLYESSPGDSLGAHGATFIDIAWDGSGTIWQPKDGFNEGPRNLQFSDDFSSFRIAGLDPYQLRTIPTTEQKLEKHFGRLEVTITSHPSQTTKPSSRSFVYTKILIPPTVTLWDASLLGLFLTPCGIWLAFGSLIDSPRAQSVWLGVSFVLITTYCVTLFSVLGFCDLFYRFIKFSWMPFVCFSASMLGLGYIRRRFKFRSEQVDSVIPNTSFS